MNTGGPDAASQASIGELPPLHKALRVAAIGVALAGIGSAFACAAGWLTPRALTPARFADTFEQLNGVHPGFRRNHAKGVCVSGTFTGNGQGAELCKAPVFQRGQTPVIGRFSLSGGMPDAADEAHTVRGLGLLFTLSDGEQWRTAMVNLPVFPARTPQVFHGLLLATAPDPATGKPDPMRVNAFLAENPESAKALGLIRGYPVSSGFENSTFNSLNDFRFVNDSGAVAWVRWSLVPAEPFAPADETGSPTADKNRLFDALIAAIHRHPLEWRLVITVAQPGDPTDDATLPWPPDRRQVDVGTLTLDHIESDDVSAARDINFDPLVLPDGICASADPILSARSAIYSQSFTRREGEEKHPAPISAAETQK